MAVGAVDVACVVDARVVVARVVGSPEVRVAVVGAAPVVGVVAIGVVAVVVVPVVVVAGPCVGACCCWLPEREVGAPPSSRRRCSVSDGLPKGIHLTCRTPPPSVPRSADWIGR